MFSRSTRNFSFPFLKFKSHSPSPLPSFSINHLSMFCHQIHGVPELEDGGIFGGNVRFLKAPVVEPSPALSFPFWLLRSKRSNNDQKMWYPPFKWSLGQYLCSACVLFVWRVWRMICRTLVSTSRSSGRLPPGCPTRWEIRNIITSMHPFMLFLGSWNSNL